MKNLIEIQNEMFQKEEILVQMANVFGALASDCRLEIIYLLLRVDALGSGEIGRLTNCSASQVSQYLSKMYDAGIVKKSRTWREVEYSLDKSDPFVQGDARTYCSWWTKYCESIPIYCGRKMKF